MSVNIPGINGRSWDKSSCILSTHGQYALTGTHGCTFGEPAVEMGTGMTQHFQNKRIVKSYDALAGAEACIGVFKEDKTAIVSRSADYTALVNRRDFGEDVGLILKGPVKITNVGTGTIGMRQTVIPANGGCQIMTSALQASLGQSLDIIPPGRQGWVDVMPDYEKARF